jgi:hypothetical protein
MLAVHAIGPMNLAVAAEHLVVRYGGTSMAFLPNPVVLGDGVGGRCPAHDRTAVPRDWIAMISHICCRRLRAAPLRAGLLLALLLMSATAARAQAPEPDNDDANWRDAAPLVFLDCQRCDDTHVRSEITFVNYVREATSAQVHVLVTDQATGGGGRQYTLAFIGRDGFSDLAHSLTYTSAQSATAAEVRDGLTSMLKLGLVPYVARTPLAPRLALSFDGAGASRVRPVTDRWNNWTFEVYGGGNFNAESTQDSWNARYGFYANRVTEQWKLRLRPYFNHNARTIRRADNPDIRIDQRRHGMETYVIRSLGGQMGAGLFAEYITHTLDNLRHGVTVTPAVEYSVFPYSEATRRSITFTYRLGYELADYFEETIYEKTEEALLSHALNASVQVRQPWGSISSGLTGSSYLHNSDFHRLTFNGNVSFRLGGGISLNVGGNYQRINDQLGLPRGNASLEDILLQRRRLATAYRGSGSIGLSYTFGSIFSNVVNPRL